MAYENNIESNNPTISDKILIYVVEVVLSTCELLSALIGNPWWSFNSKLSPIYWPWYWAFTTYMKLRVRLGWPYENQCPGCMRYMWETAPNPYYTSDKVLAEWARYVGSGTTPSEYAKFLADPPAIWKDPN